MPEPALQEKYLETENGKIFYFSRFVSEGRPTVVLLHGLSSNHTTWVDFMETLAKNGFNSLAPDLRGHGLSDKRKKRKLYELPSMRKDVEAIIEKEKLKKVYVIGYSFGGYISIDLAINSPQTAGKLVLISANYVNPMKYTPIFFLAPLCYLILNVAAFFLLWQKREKYYYFDAKNYHSYWQSTFAGFSTMPLSINFWMLSEAFRLNYKSSINKIKCPTLLMRGQGDIFISRKEINDIKNSIPDCQSVELDVPSHFLAGRHQDKIMEYIINFFEKSA